MSASYIFVLLCSYQLLIDLPFHQKLLQSVFCFGGVNLHMQPQLWRQEDFFMQLHFLAPRGINSLNVCSL